MKRYQIGFTYGKTNRAQRYLIGKATDSFEEAKAAADKLGQIPMLGHGIVEDWGPGTMTIIYHTGRDSCTR